MSTNLDLEENLLFEARQMLRAALEQKGIEETGCGFGMGQPDIDVKVNGRNFCISMRLIDLDRLDETNEEEIDLQATEAGG